eukprot:1695083-Rhodomonas_salina.1
MGIIGIGWNGKQVGVTHTGAPVEYDVIQSGIIGFLFGILGTCFLCLLLCSIIVVQISRTFSRFCDTLDKAITVTKDTAAGAITATKETAAGALEIVNKAVNVWKTKLRHLLCKGTVSELHCTQQQRQINVVDAVSTQIAEPNNLQEQWLACRLWTPSSCSRAFNLIGATQVLTSSTASVAQPTTSSTTLVTKTSTPMAALGWRARVEHV